MPAREFAHMPRSHTRFARRAAALLALAASAPAQAWQAPSTPPQNRPAGVDSQRNEVRPAPPPPAPPVPPPAPPPLPRAKPRLEPGRYHVFYQDEAERDGLIES